MNQDRIKTTVMTKNKILKWGASFDGHLVRIPLEEGIGIMTIEKTHPTLVLKGFTKVACGAKRRTPFSFWLKRCRIEF